MKRTSQRLVAGVGFAAAASAAHGQWLVLFPYDNGAFGSHACGVSYNQAVGNVEPIPGVSQATIWIDPGNHQPVSLDPVGATYGYVSGTDGTQVGAVRINGGATRASLWHGTASSWVDLSPPGTTDSWAYVVNQLLQVGYATVSGRNHASLWSGNAASWIDLNPSGANASCAYATGDGQQVGQATWDATPTEPGYQHAGLWSGTAASWVDLNPLAASGSRALGVSAAEQCGVAFADGGEWPGLWHGTPESWIDLTPTGSTGGVAYATDIGEQVGFVTIDGQSHAALWSGSASSWVDLHAMLPPGYVSSEARAIWHDYIGRTWVVGFAREVGTLNEHAFFWLITCQGMQIFGRPNDVETTPCQSAVFTVNTWPDAAACRWRRNGIDLDNDDHTSGVTTHTLTISPVGSLQGGLYSMSMTTDCGRIVSQPARLTVHLAADFNQDHDVGTDADIETFFACLAGACCNSCLSPDIDRDGDWGTDADIQAFFVALASGC